MKKNYAFFILLCALNAMAQSGTLDPTFGDNGKVHTGFGTNGYSRANAVAVQPDGKIIVGGAAYTANTVNTWQKDSENLTLVRYNTDGSFDTSFGNGGIVMVDLYKFYTNNTRSGTVYDISIQPDGKIVAYGSAIAELGSEAILMRFNSNGSIDAGFGINGKVTCNSGAVDSGNTLIIQPDGKIIALGVQSTQPSPSVWNTQFVVERFNEDGTKDTAFGTDGRVVTIFGNGGYDMPEAIALQPDGKIIAVGMSATFQFAIARYNANGSLDTTFDGDGKVTTSFGTGSNSIANFVKVHADGKILVAGHNSGGTTLSFALAQYNANGSLDTTFDGDGKATNLFDENDDSLSINSIVEQPDGKLLVTTTGNYDSTYFVTRRYNSNATPDTSFGINGSVITTIQEGYNHARGIALQDNSSIIVVGYSHALPSTQDAFTVTRYNSNGSLDTSFDTDGKITTSFDSTNDESNILLLQPDNKLVAVGIRRIHTPNNYIYKDIILSRYNTDGSLDETFGTGGKVVSAFGLNINKINSAIVQPDGKIVVMNTYYNNSVDNLFHYELIRYATDGAIDTTFGTDGHVTVDAESSVMLSQPDGKIITLSAYYNNQNIPTIVVNRYNNNGTPDTGFGTNGIATTPGTLFGLTNAVLQPDGKILVSYNGMNENGYVGFSAKRFNTNGSLDNNFITTITVVDNGAYSHTPFIQPDGKIIVTGRSIGNNAGVYFQFVAARYNTDGSPDTTYGTNGVVASYMAGSADPYNVIQAVVRQPDGKFIVALSKLEQYPANPTPDTYDFVISRFKADGGYDYDFGSQGQVNTAFYNKYDEAFSMVLQPDNKIVMGGTTDIGINRDFALARFQNDIDLGNEDFTAVTSNLVLYPNPAKSILNIKLPNQTGVTITGVTVYNTLGQMVYNTTKNTDKIDLGHLQSGIYTIKVATGKSEWNGKFIKE